MLLVYLLEHYDWWDDKVLNFAFVSNGMLIVMSFVLFIAMLVFFRDLHVLHLMMKLSRLTGILSLSLNIYTIILIFSAVATQLPSTPGTTVLYMIYIRLICTISFIIPVLALSSVLSAIIWIRIWHMEKGGRGDVCGN